MNVNQPTDSDLVHRAIRLGWVLAEVGGQYRRLAASDPSDPAVKLGPNMLPIAAERSERAKAIQAQRGLEVIRCELNFDVPVPTLSQMPKGVSGPVSEYLRTTLQPLAQLGQPSPVRTKRAATADHILAMWDAYIQDELYGQSLAAHAGYQVGRALGEVDWCRPALNCTAADLRDVLSAERCGAIAVLLSSLSAYFDPLCVKGVAGSFSAWSDFVFGEANMTTTVSPQISKQTWIWRSLLVEQADPQAWLNSESALAWVHTTWKVLSSFQLAVWVSVASAAALVTGAFLLALAGSAHIFGAGVSVLGLLGITAAGIVARAKNASEDIVSRIRGQAQLDLITGAITRLPSSKDMPAE